ncbi:sulfatase [Lutimonas saemankumensis]|uniref:sulfatase family protein n=1 Tax=Lutimonas saemankumensis TaxID=483016 RepID=UPI001CD29448|nr:sulfatase [Lutimonas saemankumensis]MCA0932487.1 sulfatase [Lutimonas saemankumensis]
MTSKLVSILIIWLLGFQIQVFSQSDKTNFIIFLTDDQGYNDVGCFGSPNIKTPNLDQMAKNGIRFTSFYAQPVCGPSRAALLTGSYPIRVAEPNNTKGLHTKLHPKEITIAEVLKSEGYKTACIGKWHAGETTEQMPLKQGFDYYYGTPKYNGNSKLIEQSAHRSPILRNNDTLMIINTVEEMGQLTNKYTKEATNFIRQNKTKPFFLYLAHNMPHVPIGASDKFREKSEGGLYGDVIEELDWSMGEVLKTLKEEGLEENTLVIFVSDNGPWIEEKIGDHGGSAFPLRGNKTQTWEGGIRVPAIMQWKGHIPENVVSDELLNTMDFLPTFAAISNAKLVQDITLDGKDFSGVIVNNEQSRHDRFYYYSYTHLQAVRDKEWKLVLPRKAKPKYMKWAARKVEAVEEVQLFNLKNDKEEQHNLAEKYPEKVKELMVLLEEGRYELGDHDLIGNGARFYDSGPKTQRIDEYYKWKNNLKK